MVEIQAISGRLERGEIDGARYLEELMRFVATRIGCSRAGLRLFIEEDGRRVLRTIALYDPARARIVPAEDIFLTGGAYLEQLKRQGSVAITDAQVDPLSVGGLREHLARASVVSLLDVACAVNGTLYGMFSCEQVGPPIVWSQRQVTTLRSIASRASLSLMHLLHAVVDTAPGALWDSSLPNRLVTMPATLGPREV